MPFLQIMQIVGVALSALGLYQGAQVARAQQKYQAKIAKVNQKSAEMEASYARDIAHKKSGEAKMKARRFSAKQRAAQASAGFVVGEGTFGDILEDTAVIGELDALAIRHEGELAAWRAGERAKAASAQSALYAGASKSLAGDIGAAGTLLTGLADIDWGKFGKKG